MLEKFGIGLLAGAVIGIMMCGAPLALVYIIKFVLWTNDLNIEPKTVSMYYAFCRGVVAMCLILGIFVAVKDILSDKSY